MFRTKTITLALTILLVTSAKATAVGVPGTLGISSWTNTKTTSNDLMFTANQSEAITFTVNASAPGAVTSYQWQVNRAVVSGATGKSYAWTVPAETSVWEITVLVTNANNGTCKTVVWSVTTGRLITVAAGGSIQGAIDDIEDDSPYQGGIVELSTGTYYVTGTPAAPGTIRIKKSNITVRGAGVGSTTIDGLTNNGAGCVFMITSCDYPVYDHWWMDEHGDKKYRIPSTDYFYYGDCQSSTATPDAFVRNVTIGDLHIIGCPNKDTSWDDCAEPGENPDAFHLAGLRDGIFFYQGWECIVFNTKIEKAYGSVYLSISYDFLITDNELCKNGRGLMFDQGTDATVARNNVYENSYYGFDLNTSCWHNDIINNTFHSNAFGVKLYSASNHNDITGNLITDSDKEAFIIFDSGNNTITRNVIANSRHGLWQWGESYASRTQNNRIIGNIMHNLEFGIYIAGGASPVEVRNNIITSCCYRGIEPEFADVPALRGITHAVCSYNSVWNVKLGAGTAPNTQNYDTTTGFVSANPRFVNAPGKDFHLMSRAGRWNNTTKTWVTDNVTSPCIDAGDPADTFSDEPAPNGGRINMGVYGSTPLASKSGLRGRYVLYNTSAFDANNAAANSDDDGAIAPDKTAILPGGESATFANYTSYSRGINGIMMDIPNLPAGTPTASDFIFKVGNPAAAQTILEANFDSNTNGFTYFDDTFRGTNNPSYISGNRIASGAYSGGGLRVHVYMDGDGTKYMSGGWKRTFNLSSASRVRLTLRYKLSQKAACDAGEYSEALVSIDGNLFGIGGNDYLAKLLGSDYNDTGYDTGWQMVVLDLGVLSAGSHTLIIGAHAKVSNYSEEVEMLIDDVSVVAGIADPGNWANAPAPTSISVRRGAGSGETDRVTILWANNAIQKQWLQVTAKATAATGLSGSDVFYFGNAIGETGNSATDAMVKPTDEIGARNNPHTLGENPAGIDDAYDFNRDKKVGPTDEIIARSNGTNSSTALQLITSP